MQTQLQNLLKKRSRLYNIFTKNLMRKPFLPFIVISFLITASISDSLAIEQNEIKEYGIVILPEEECAKVAEDLNHDIQKELSDLKNVKNHWHVTLYHGAYETKDLQQIYNKLKQLKFQPFALNFTKIYSTADRWIDLGTEKTTYLQELHTSVVYLASPFHKRALARSKDIYNKMPSIQRKQVDNYGVSGVLELYNPHMTLFYQYPPRPELEYAAKKIAANFKGSMVCKASRIIIGELGYNGNIERIVHGIDLPN